MGLTERLSILIDSKANIKGFRDAAKAAEDSGSRMDKFAGKVGVSSDALRAGMTTAALAAGAAVAKFAADGIKAASDLNEQVAASEVTFGDAADKVKAFGRTAADSLGLSNRAALEAANQFGGLFKAAGFAADEAAGFSLTMTTLASDLASFKNLNPEDVLLKLRSGLSGESEPLKALGIFIDEASTSTEALSLGLAATNKELTTGDKILARYSLILKKTTDAQGDAARTAESFANQQRKLAAESEDLKASAGDVLLPIATEFTTLGNHGLDAMGKLGGGTEKAKESIRGLVTMGLYPAVQGFNDLFGGSKDAADGLLTYENAEIELQAAIKAGNQERAKEALSIIQVREEAEKHKKALEEEKKALDALTEGVMNRIDADLNYRNAIDGTKEAEQNYLDVVKEKGRASAEADDALRGLEGAMLSQADAIVRLKDEQAKANGEMLTAQQKSVIYRQELETLRASVAPGSPLWNTLDGYIQMLKRIPGSVSTNVNFEPTFRTGGRIQVRAHGGPVSAGDPYMVGERGPELFVPKANGMIVPNNRLGGGGGSGGSQTFNVTINQQPGQSGDDVVAALKLWMRRNGPLPLTVR